MNHASPAILIIGGGVAGMAAARALDHQDVQILLVEKRNVLGGHAGDWACMATDTCANCSACLCPEMVEQTARQTNVRLFLDNNIQSLTREEDGFHAGLTSGESIRADKIILATGFSPFDPTRLSSLQPGDRTHVISTAQLNTLLQEDRFTERFKGNPAPRIAFIQCVGSRNRDIGNDYCSQVCCKISMRHADKLIHLIPDARITLFYMDLQIIGKETRTMALSLAGKVELVQGVPAEILENPETSTLSMVLEDPGTRNRVKKEFDLVVLSVGMEPSKDLKKTTDILGISPNPWGFFNTEQAVIKDHIYVAGCAAGPKDILASRQEGFLTGARVLKDLGLVTGKNQTLCVIGDGSQAGAGARAAAAQGYPVTCFDGARAKILGIHGTAGNFSILFEENGKKERFFCDAIIAAPEPGRKNIPEQFSGALNLDRYSQTAPADLPDRAAILLDYFGPEFKTEARKALTSALAAQKAGKTIFVIMNKMLVHSPEGQQLYDQSRKNGIRFFRYNTRQDLNISPRGGAFSVKIREATLPGLDLDLGDLALVLPASIQADPEFECLANQLRDRTDREGFLQSANVRHRITRSPRKGIFYCGTCHDETDDQDLEKEITAILSVLETRDRSSHPPGIRINEKKCVKCLTCFRVCPHAAIVLNEKSRPEIVPDACYSCHLCLVSCPANAIVSEEFSTDGLVGQVESHGRGKTVILACERSAALAAAPLDLPAHLCLIPVPCACRVSSALILKVLINGADRVIVSGCHEENCRSISGTTAAQEGVESVLRIPGISPEKVAWEPIAANETQKFFRMISDM